LSSKRRPLTRPSASPGSQATPPRPRQSRWSKRELIKLAIYVALDARSPHRITALDVSPRPTTLRHQPPFVENPADEQVELATSYRQLAATQRRHPLPKMPFIVISHGIPDAPMGAEVVPGINKATETEWQHMQIKLAQLVPGGKRIVATASDHMIPTGQPGLVVRTIRAVRAELAAGTRRR
jgi:hypothetical protein